MSKKLSPGGKYINKRLTKVTHNDKMQVSGCLPASFGVMNRIKTDNGLNL